MNALIEGMKEVRASFDEALSSAASTEALNASPNRRPRETNQQLFEAAGVS